MKTNNLERTWRANTRRYVFHLRRIPGEISWCSSQAAWEACSDCFNLVWFYGILSIVGYLMPNSFYTYILDMNDFFTHFVDNIFKRNWSHFFFCIQLNGFIYFYLIRIILYTSNCLIAHSWMYCHLTLTIQSNISHLFTQTIQFSISHLFALILNVKQFYLTHRSDPIRYYYSGPEWTWEWWQWKCTPPSPKLHH